MTHPVPRDAVAALPGYVPGGRGAGGGTPPIKLSSNETPFPPPPPVVTAIAEAGSLANRYPDMFSAEVTERLAARLELDSAQIAVGAGSVAVLGHLLHAFCDPGAEVVYAWRSFEAYPILAQIAGAVSVRVPLDAKARHDLDAMAGIVSDRTTVVILCSPNNPTGPGIEAGAFERFMEAVPRRVLVVLDEAYVEFAGGRGLVDGREALERHPNLVVTRTFSKAYGLAGLRVGYAMGAIDLVAPIRACVTPFSVSGVAQAAVLASLDAEAELFERVERVVAERERVTAALRADRWTIPRPDGNFFWIAAGSATAALAGHLSREDPVILVRPFAGEGVRITVGSTEENDRLIERIAGFPDRF